VTERRFTERLLKIVGHLRESGLTEGLVLETDSTGILVLPTADHEHRRIGVAVRKALEGPLEARGLELGNDTEFLTAPGHARVPDLFVADPDGLAPMREGRASSTSGLLMMVEVTSGNRENDTVGKVKDYGLSQIPVYLIIDRKVGKALVYSDPTEIGYGTPVEVPVGEVVWLPRPIALKLDTAPLLQHL
jgi:hypothetical protein